MRGRNEESFRSLFGGETRRVSNPPGGESGLFFGFFFGILPRTPHPSSIRVSHVKRDTPDDFQSYRSGVAGSDVPFEHSLLVTFGTDTTAAPSIAIPPPTQSRSDQFWDSRSSKNTTKQAKLCHRIGAQCARFKSEVWTWTPDSNSSCDEQSILGWHSFAKSKSSGHERLMSALKTSLQQRNWYFDSEPSYKRASCNSKALPNWELRHVNPHNICHGPVSPISRIGVRLSSHAYFRCISETSPSSGFH